MSYAINSTKSITALKSLNTVTAKASILHKLNYKGVRCGRSRWFGHVERKNGGDWVSACRNVEVTGVRCADRGRKRECVN